MEEIVREFVADVDAAYGANGQELEEIIESLEADWYDLAQTYKKALDVLGHDHG